MSTYAIGDLQGCYTTLQRLLEKIAFNPDVDRLWFVGDLVNRGADSLACLRFVKSLGERAVTVLGNHDLHLLAMAQGIRKANASLQPVLDAPDCAELLLWLRQQKLLHVDGRHAMVHAGLLPQWSITQALSLAHEVEIAISGAEFEAFIAHMYGDQPCQWIDALQGNDRLRIIVNAMTRMRMLTRDGALELSFNGDPKHAPASLLPWFEFTPRAHRDVRLITGHWSALGLRVSDGLVCLDSGCVWGRQLTAMRLEDSALFQVECAEIAPALGAD